MAGVASLTRRGLCLRLMGVALVSTWFGLLCAAPSGAAANPPAPRLYLPRCPGWSQPLLSSSFPPGVYDLTSSHATFAPSTLTVRADGTTTKVTATVDDDARGTFAVDATPQSTGAAAYSFQWTLDSWPLGYNIDAGSYTVTGGCFGPGNTVDLSVEGPAITPPPVTVDADGYISAALRVTAGTSRTALTVTATDAASGRSAAATFPVPATTLPAGEQLSSAARYDYQDLYSPNLSYELSQGGCTTHLQHIYSVAGVVRSPTTWWVGTGSSFGSCRLRLLSSGDLVLVTAGGKQIWDTGTRTTGSNNRLAVLNDGDLVLRTAAHHPVWTSRTGLIRGPHGFVTHAPVTLTRSGARIDVTGVVRQYTVNGTLRPGAGRVVDLERKNGASWQVYRSKKADASGRIRFTFLQATPHSYRLKVMSTRQLATAFSRIVRR